MNCSYLRIYRGFDENNNPTISKDKCSSKHNLREIEFKHPEYRDQSSSCYLCDHHFLEVFSEIDETEKKAQRDFLNAKFNYNKDFAHARKYGEYFDSQTFREQNYTKVERAYDKYQLIRKKQCRYEECVVDLSGIRKVFVIRIYSQSGREWANYYFCSKEHWTKIKYRVGLEIPNIDNEKLKAKTLDDYTKKDTTQTDGQPTNQL